MGHFNSRHRQVVLIRHHSHTPFTNSLLSNSVRCLIRRQFSIFIAGARGVNNCLSRRAVRFSSIPFIGSSNRHVIIRSFPIFRRQVNFKGGLRVPVFSTIIRRLRGVTNSPHSSPLTTEQAVIRLNKGSLRSIFRRQPDFRQASKRREQTIRNSFLTSQGSNSSRVSPFLFRLLRAAFHIIRIEVTSISGCVTEQGRERRLQSRLICEAPHFSRRRSSVEAFRQISRLFSQVHSSGAFTFTPTVSGAICSSLFTKCTPIVCNGHRAFTLRVRHRILTRRNGPSRSCVYFRVSIIFVLGSVWKAFFLAWLFPVDVCLLLYFLSKGPSFLVGFECV